MTVCGAPSLSRMCRSQSLVTAWPMLRMAEITWVSNLDTEQCKDDLHTSASIRSIRRFVITEKAPTRTFSWFS